jgi:hypothetical protein
MSNNNSWANFDETVMNEIEEASVAKVSEGFKQPESGIYAVSIMSAYLRKTDSGAEMFELVMQTKDENQMRWSTCTKSGDAKGNKSTWTVQDRHSDFTKKKYGVGTEVPLPGYQELAQLFASFGSKMKDEQPDMGQIEHRDTVIDAKIFKGLTGKKLQACVQQFEEEYNGEVSVKLDYQMFIDLEGNNEKGEPMEEKFTKKINKTPLRKMKVTAPVVSTGSETAASTGW